MDGFVVEGCCRSAVGVGLLLLSSALLFLVFRVRFRLHYRRVSRLFSYLIGNWNRKRSLLVDELSKTLRKINSIYEGIFH